MSSTFFPNDIRSACRVIFLKYQFLLIYVIAIAESLATPRLHPMFEGASVYPEVKKAYGLSFNSMTRSSKALIGMYLN